MTLITPFDGRSQYYLHDAFLDLIWSHVNVTRFHLWEPFHDSLSNVTKELEEMKYIPMNRLIERLQSVNVVPTESKGWIYLFLGDITVVTLGVIIVIYRKYSDKIKTYWLAIRGGNEGKSTRRSLPRSCELAAGESTSTDSTIRTDNPTPGDKGKLHTEDRKLTSAIDILSVK